MLTVTQNLVLPTTITGSYPKPQWHSLDLQGRPFKEAMGHSLFSRTVSRCRGCHCCRSGGSGS